METRIVVSPRAVLLTGLVLLGLLAAYLAGSAGRAGLPAGASEEAPAASDRRTLSLTGTGEVTAVPDRITFGLTSTRTRPDLEDALAASSRTMRRVLQALAEYGVGRTEVQTSGLRMDPVYAYPDDAPPVLVGYRVAQRARVTVPELRDGGRAVSAAVTAGGNGVRVGGIRLEVSDLDDVLTEAREGAVAEATRKAEEYAAASGQALGPVLSLRELSGRSRTAVFESAASSFDLANRATLPIRAGEDELRVRVAVVWELG